MKMLQSCYSYNLQIKNALGKFLFVKTASCRTQAVTLLKIRLSYFWL